MTNCSLSKHKSYEIQNIVFNSVDKSYKLTLAENPMNCVGGIFTSKKLELKVVPENKTPYLHFNKQDGLPELVLNNLALVRQDSVATRHESTTVQHEPMVINQGMQASPMPHFPFLYVLLGIVVVVLLIRFIFKKRNESSAPFYPNNNNQNNLLGGNSNNPQNPQFQNGNPPPGNYPYNNGQMGQGPSRTGSFISGLAGGALGAVVGNSLYDKFKGNDAQAAQNPNSSNNADDTFSSDGDDSSSSFDDSGSDDSFSSDN